MAQQRKRLPQQVAAHLDAHREALAAIASGEDRTEDAVQAADEAVRAAWAHAEAGESQAGFGSATFTASFDQIIAERLAETRAEAGWTQAQLADAIAPYANWTRFTVAEIETGRRNVSLEELVVLASLYGEPILNFMIPTGRTILELDHTNVAPGVLAELFVGRGGAIGNGGRSWAAAVRVASEPGPRPAVDLWANRTANSSRRTPPALSKARTRKTKKDT